MVRGRGYARSVEDFSQVVVKTGTGGVPVLLQDIARIELGPEMRRGVSDLDGLGDHVGGIVVMRHGENALNVIERVKDRLKDLEPSMPKGVEFITTYDRSGLIEHAIATLRHELTIEMIIVSLVILLFLWHIPSAIVPIVTIPISVLLAFIPLYYLGVTVNIMSLAGIAISIGVLVDGRSSRSKTRTTRSTTGRPTGRRATSIKSAWKRCRRWGPRCSSRSWWSRSRPADLRADRPGRAPVQAAGLLENLAMALAALLAITLDPAMRMMFARIEPFRFRPRLLSWVATKVAVGTYYPEERHPVSRVIFRVYEPACRFVLRHPRSVIAGALLLVVATIPAYRALGSEFMPPLNEGSILYMPTTLPGISVAQAEELMRTQDRVLKSFPEVERVFGKAGRAETSTDPAPFSMMETTVTLKPSDEWRSKERWYSSWAPWWLKPVLQPIWPDRISWDELVDEFDGRCGSPASRTPGRCRSRAASTC